MLLGHFSSARMLSIIAITAGFLGFGENLGLAQQVVVLRPTADSFLSAPLPVVAYRPADPYATAYLGSPSTVVYRPVAPLPVVNMYPPAVSPSVGAPAVAAYYAPTPVAAYQVPIAPVAPVVIRPKVYVPGQPLRNMFRAVTP